MSNHQCVSCNGDGKFCGWCGLPAYSICECSGDRTDAELCGDCGGIGTADVLECEPELTDDDE